MSNELLEHLQARLSRAAREAMGQLVAIADKATVSPRELSRDEAEFLIGCELHSLGISEAEAETVWRFIDLREHALSVR